MFMLPYCLVSLLQYIPGTLPGYDIGPHSAASLFQVIDRKLYIYATPLYGNAISISAEAFMFKASSVNASWVVAGIAPNALYMVKIEISSQNKHLYLYASESKLIDNHNITELTAPVVFDAFDRASRVSAVGVSSLLYAIINVTEWLPVHSPGINLGRCDNVLAVELFATATRISGAGTGGGYETLPAVITKSTSTLQTSTAIVYIVAAIDSAYVKMVEIVVSVSQRYAYVYANDTTFINQTYATTTSLTSDFINSAWLNGTAHKSPATGRDAQNFGVESLGYVIDQTIRYQ